ncbi:MAG: hypothetical protein Q7U04_03625 [Bacteriovorax sp.]|nr:hypothetical protein [Bacteriovorax sp.]
MIRASIDIGSNSVLLLAAEMDEAGTKIVSEVLNLSYITSLGKDLDKNKEFHPDSMKATYEALLDYKNQLLKIKINPQAVIVTATEAARVARNSPEFFLKIKNELGFEIQIISSEAEAFYTARGVASGHNDVSTVVIMDIGGASTELIKVELRPFKIIDSISLPVGAVRANDWIQGNIFDQKMEEIFSHNLNFYKTKSLLCVAGGMTSMAAMYLGLKEFSAEKIEGLTISFNSFKLFSLDLQKTNKENLLLLFPFLGKRVEVIAAAAKVAILFSEKLNIEEIKISSRGLRYGTLLAGEIDEKFTSR